MRYWKERVCGVGVTERVLSDDASPWFMEHAARYRLAAGYVAGTSVLDVEMRDEGDRMASRGMR